MNKELLNHLSNYSEDELKIIINQLRPIEQYFEFNIFVNYDRGLGNEYKRLDDIIVAKSYEEAKNLAIEKVNKHFIKKKKTKIKEVKVKLKLDELS